MEKDSLDTIGGRLKYCRKIARLTRPHLERDYKISQSSVYCYETNMKQPSDNRLKKFLEIFKNENIIVNYQWLKTGYGDLPQEFKCSSSSKNILNTNYQNIYDSIQLIKQEEIQIKKMHSNSIFFSCDSFDLEPLLGFGDRVAGIPVYTDLKKYEDKFCIIRYNEIIFIKILIKYNLNGTLNFSGINQKN
ncbi:MAG: helix-turn-helix domain-containing protein [Silvanigrellaceae bacterium]|nr:helix-turn-helix domain-containing protein [Silvanigrellaceae bacterium]